MSASQFQRSTLVELAGHLHLLTLQTGHEVYDFPFERYFSTRHPVFLAQPVKALARVGAVEDYEAFFNAATEAGITLLVSPAQHRVVSTLAGWYPYVKAFTARSVVYDELPTAAQIEAQFRWPVFIKGERQTARHAKALSIVHSREAYETLRARWHCEPILSWQRLVVRDYLALRPLHVTDDHGHRLPPSVEYRAFVWRGRLVGFGPYWAQGKYESLSPEARREALQLVHAVVSALPVPCVVVDVAQTLEGRWVLLECNDFQESGYATLFPLHVWEQVLALEATLPNDKV